jgi:hypothetical protein
MSIIAFLQFHAVDQRMSLSGHKLVPGGNAYTVRTAEAREICTFRTPL